MAKSKIIVRVAQLNRHKWIRSEICLWLYSEAGDLSKVVPQAQNIFTTKNETNILMPARNIH